MGGHLSSPGFETELQAGRKENFGIWGLEHREGEHSWGGPLSTFHEWGAKGPGRALQKPLSFDILSPTTSSLMEPFSHCPPFSLVLLSLRTTC